MSAQRRLLDRLSMLLIQHIEPIFLPHADITLIVRTPGDNGADVLVTTDDLDSIVALIERSRARKEVRL